MRRLAREDCQLLTVGRDEVDLRRQERSSGGSRTTIRTPFLCQRRLWAVSSPMTRGLSEFLYDNLMIAANVIEASRRAGVKKLLFSGSSCIYPRLAPQPIVEEALLTGPLEPTNQWYAVSKIAGLELCAAYRREY
jgi:GDP-L-fucose synthase